jgi:hypothetical protein
MKRSFPHSKTGGWGFESLHSCQEIKDLANSDSMAGPKSNGQSNQKQGG